MPFWRVDRKYDVLADKQRNRLNWLGSPLLMIVSFLAALLLCIGHHEFYRSLNGQKIDEALSQAWATRIATGLAYLIRALLVLATGIAYVQWQWSILKRNSIQIGQVDTVTSILTDLRAFLRPYIWLNTPLLALAAGISWLLPLSVIITPATLTVTSNCAHQKDHARVSQLSFNTSAYSVFSFAGTNFAYAQQSPEVTRIAFATAASRQIQTISSEYRNMSYSLQFDGPAITCDTANQTMQDNAYKVFHDNDSGNVYVYASLVPGGDEGILDGNWTRNSLKSSAYPTLDTKSEDVARIFFISALGECDQCPNPWKNVTECHLYNATYNVNFNFSSIDQNVTVKSFNLLEPLPAINVRTTSPDTPENRTDSASPVSAHESYQAVMQAFGALFVGIAQRSFSAQTSYQIISIDWTRIENTQRDLEQLFQNITLSLLSSPQLLKNGTNADSVPIEVITCPPIYTYEPRDLLISYGVGLLASLSCILFGLYAFHSNNASYSNKFSTYLRTTRDTDLRELVSSADVGANPLPRSIKEKRIFLAAESGGSGETGENDDPKGEYIELGRAK